MFQTKTKFIRAIFLTGAVLMSQVGMAVPVYSEESKGEKIEEIQEQIDEIDEKIDEKRQKERTISTELEIIDESVGVIRLEMGKTQQIVAGLDSDIMDKTKAVEALEQDLETKKDILGEYLRKLAQGKQEQHLILLINGGSMEDYFELIDSLEKVQEEIGRIVEKIGQDKQLIEAQRGELEEKRGEQSQVLLMQEDQRKTLEYEEQRKQRLLNQTQKDINLLDVEKNELRDQLNSLQSLGTSINLEEAIETAEYASDKTGVRAAFLLGVLRVESNLGQNVGGGRYKTDMNPSQHDLFKKICKELKLDPSDMPVSKRVCYNTKSKDGCGGWGGAMGPAQFMPSTWVGYKDRVAKVTGHRLPSPWNLRDAMVAMGLKLAAVSGVTDHKRSAERQAAAMYLAGGNWQNYTWYGDRVLYYADGFERYMKED